MSKPGPKPIAGTRRNKITSTRYTDEELAKVAKHLPYKDNFVRNTTITAAELIDKGVPKDEFIQTLGEIAYHSAYQRIDITKIKSDENQLKLWVDDET